MTKISESIQDGNALTIDMLKYLRQELETRNLNKTALIVFKDEFLAHATRIINLKINQNGNQSSTYPI